MRILVVEDEQILREQLAQKLKSEGYVVDKMHAVMLKVW